MTANLGSSMELPLQPLNDDMKLEIGKLVFEKFFGVDGGRVEEATRWLESIGFNRVEWANQDSDDILILMLWRFQPPYPNYYQTRDEFILEFSGYDAATISLFNLVKEVSM